ncbi:hypothetical protein D3C76_1043400 [compost metagenome]
MGLISEDFLRCECGNAEFERKTIVTIDKSSKRTKEPIELEERHEYYCTSPACGKKLTL